MYIHIFENWITFLKTIDFADSTACNVWKKLRSQDKYNFDVCPLVEGTIITAILYKHFNR